MPTPTYAGGPRSGSSCGIVKVSTVSQMVALQVDKSTCILCSRILLIFILTNTTVLTPVRIHALYDVHLLSEHPSHETATLGRLLGAV